MVNRYLSEVFPLLATKYRIGDNSPQSDLVHDISGVQRKIQHYSPDFTRKCNYL